MECLFCGKSAAGEWSGKRQKVDANLFVKNARKRLH
jgi:hypothetical protein